VRRYAAKSRVLFIDSDTAGKVSGARFRRSRPGPELELIESFLGAMPLHVPQDCRATVFRVPRLESGFPDLVIVVWREEITLDWRPERVCLRTQDLRLIHFLHHCRRASEVELVRWFGRGTTASIKRLRNAAMIQFVGSSWVPSALSHSFAASKIIAVEAKVDKWNEVLNQALLNTWFASKSYVLVPRLPSNSQLLAAQQLGIGVCSFCGGEVREVASRSTRLPRSYASWILNEWAWRSSHEDLARMTT